MASEIPALVEFQSSAALPSGSYAVAIGHRGCGKTYLLSHVLRTRIGAAGRGDQVWSYEEDVTPVAFAMGSMKSLADNGVRKPLLFIENLLEKGISVAHEVQNVLAVPVPLRRRAALVAYFPHDHDDSEVTRVYCEFAHGRNCGDVATFRDYVRQIRSMGPYTAMILHDGYVKWFRVPRDGAVDGSDDAAHRALRTPPRDIQDVQHDIAVEQKRLGNLMHEATRLLDGLNVTDQTKACATDGSSTATAVADAVVPGAAPPASESKPTAPTSSWVWRLFGY